MKSVKINISFTGAVRVRDVIQKHVNGIVSPRLNKGCINWEEDLKTNITFVETPP